MVADWIALSLQAIGGAIVDTAGTEDSMSGGTHILVAGLSFQVVGLILFMLIVGEYAFKVKSESSRRQVADWAAGEANMRKGERKMRYLCYGMNNHGVQFHVNASSSPSFSFPLYLPHHPSKITFSKSN
ncbi:hypothetical protein OCU04_002558 [Sclerotinia nivalis]|uniref:Uncharacterized protein n=1 Tax=Sclerotinia nivalis TaxID=352851 RepID=A0A9X0AUK5_9HELO|nr:hypothetical protein OCU04_002558 [Sclerotinia nivalis]